MLPNLAKPAAKRGQLPDKGRDQSPSVGGGRRCEKGRIFI